MTNIDLDAYLSRIGFAGRRAASLDCLAAIHALHPAAIPFENLNPLLRMPVALDIESLQTKLVTEKRGGYCFEHNLLLKSVLESIGFQVTGLAARVIWNRAEDAITSRSHMLLIVMVENEPYIADVGFGGQTLTAPLRFQTDIAQQTPHEPFRLIRAADELVLQSKIAGVWKALYRFDRQPQHLIDYELTNWYLSNHPQSRFVTELVAARSVTERRYGLLNNQLSTHELSGETIRRKLTSEHELREALEDIFTIRVPEHPALSQTLARIAQREG